ncbi:MAG: hypothetical protein ACHQ01_06400 [Candidatus Limnocylindrales bacterium]
MTNVIRSTWSRSATIAAIDPADSLIETVRRSVIGDDVPTPTAVRYGWADAWN